jgi:hypothetical protein
MIGKPSLFFLQKSHNFGHLSQGTIASHYFWFKNTGKSDLMIEDVEVTCGCTVPVYKKEAVSPGDSGYIEIQFNTSGYEGLQYKTICVKSNATNDSMALSLQAEIDE